MRQSVQSLNQVREQAQDEAREVNVFEHVGIAELYSARDRKTGRSSGYKRFDSVAEAVRFFIEELPLSIHASAYLDINETRFSYRDIERLYDSPNYPLTRRVLA